jgi:Ca2+/H+ antiporter, TMEM165/GDT1 family
MNKFRVLKGIKILLFVVVATFVFGFLVRGLWNWLMPSLFGLHEISFAQALGLFLLAKILFGGFHRGGGRGPGRMWRHKMKERWEGMSEEEREKFRAGMRDRGGWCRPRAAGPVG